MEIPVLAPPLVHGLVLPPIPVLALSLAPVGTRDTTGSALPWAGALRAAAGIAVVAAGLASVGGAGWALMAAHQAVQGRLIAFAASAPRAPAALTVPTELADNMP